LKNKAPVDNESMKDIAEDSLEFDEVGAESEDDVSAGLTAQVSRAVLWATDWTIETLYGQLSKGNIELNPEFQRREAWNDTKKSRFIESVLLGFPIPQIVLAERKDKTGAYCCLAREPFESPAAPSPALRRSLPCP
jgi:hypothetical protein